MLQGIEDIGGKGFLAGKSFSVMLEYFLATTKSIELLPREVKDKIFDLIVEKKSIDVIGDFLKSNA